MTSDTPEYYQNQIELQMSVAAHYKSPYYQSPYPTPSSPNHTMDNTPNFNYRDHQHVYNSNTPTNPQQRQQASNNDRASLNTNTNLGAAYNAGRELPSNAVAREMSFAQDSVIGGNTSHSPKAKTRKPRITLDYEDHLIIMRSCVANKSEMQTEARKTAFWEIIRQDLLQQTNKDLALPKQVVERLMRDRHFYLENHPEERGSPPKDEITKLTDEWIAHIEEISGPEPGEQRWKLPPQQERRIRHAGMMAADKSTPGFETPIPPPTSNKRRREPSLSRPQQDSMFSLQNPIQEGIQINEDDDAMHTNLESLFGQSGSQSQQSMFHHNIAPALKRGRVAEDMAPPQRVVIEGGLTKKDWLEIVSSFNTNDPRISALEAKIDTLVVTTNRTQQMLLQFLKNAKARPGTNGSATNDAVLNATVGGDGGASGGVD